MKTPLEMPTSGMSQQIFEPQRVDYAAPEAGGRVAGVQAGFPLWLATWTIGTVGARKSDDLRAFMLQLRGATRRFLGRDLGRPFPLAHIGGFGGMVKAGGGAFTGDCSSWSEAITADDDSQLTLRGLPVALTLSVGDYIGFRWVATSSDVAGLTWHACARVVAGGVADAGGNLTVTSEPPLSPAIPLTAVAYLNSPACVMAQVTDKSQLGAIDRRLAVTGGTIVGVQDIRP